MFLSCDFLIKSYFGVRRAGRKLSRRRRPAPTTTQTPEIRIDELKDDELKDESEDGYASDSTSDSASELDYADTEDTSTPTRLDGTAVRRVISGTRSRIRRLNNRSR